MASMRRNAFQTASVLLIVSGLLLGACRGGDAGTEALPRPSVPETTAMPIAEPAPAPTTAEPAPAVSLARQPTVPPSTTGAERRAVIGNRNPQVVTTPGRATVGETVRFTGIGFTDSMWQSDDTLWIVNSDEAGCALYAEAEKRRVTVTADGRLEGEFVVPSWGGCRQSEPFRGFDVAPGTYGLVYGCTPCRIGELTVVEAALTSQSRLRADGIGPIRIGMTMDDATKAAGTPLVSEAVSGCVELVPVDPSLRFGIWSHDGRTVDMISMTNPSFATTGGIRVGSALEALELAYPYFTKNVDEGTYIVVRGGYGLALVFEIRGGRVVTMFAGPQEQIEFGGHCP